VGAAVACGVLVTALTSHGGGNGARTDGTDSSQAGRALAVHFDHIPGVGGRLLARIPDNSRQVVAVYGDGRNSADSTLVVYRKNGGTWERTRAWAAHNGKKGWTTDHHEGDDRSPVGVFTLSDAGGVFPNPGAKLPYTASPATFQPPRAWGRSYWHDFDYVIAIDYNRVRGTPPTNPIRPEGEAKGGSIWLHVDNGSGTAACVTVSRPDMRYLLRTLDPRQHPVVVMGDRADLAA
jgi:L,D-peptidoglycan transpeptidase YkuD (ErfK/YbiS/YcfS/YnhG family)